MTDFETRRKKFAEELHKLESRRDEALSEKLAQDLAGGRALALNLEGRLQEWEARLDRRLAEYRGGELVPVAPAVEEAPSIPQPVAIPPAQPPQPRRGRHLVRPGATLESWLHDLDQMMLVELELSRFPRPAGLAGEVRVVESTAELKRIVDDLFPLPGLIEKNHVHSHTLGVIHLPDKGTLLNLEHYQQELNRPDDDPGAAHAHAHLISEVARERWGWGYLLEYTALGQEAGTAGLWPALIANRFELPGDSNRAAQTAAVLRQSWLLLEAGWMDWVWQYAMFKARYPIGAQLFHQPRPGRVLELLNRIVNLFPLFIVPFGVRIRLLNLLDLFKFLFLEESDLLPRTEHSVLTYLEQFCLEHDAAVFKSVGEPLSRLFGRFYFSMLESNIGILPTPYAMLIATHVTNLNLASVQPQHMAEQIQQEPRLCPDTRLAMLSRLDSRVKYDPRAMYAAAWERLHLDGPRQYFVE